MPELAAIYLRQSLDRDGTMLAVARQREDALAICEAEGWESVEYIDNDVSASDKRKDRPGYDRMVDDYEAGRFRVMVCWDLDRLTRQPKQLEEWIDRAEESGLRIVTANGEADLSTDSGRLFARIKLAVARGEVERKGARQKRSARQRAESGASWWPTRPFGFEMDGTHRQDEAEALREVYSMILRGASLQRATRWLGERFTTPKGNPWRAASLKPILVNPRNAGIRSYKGEEVGKAAWEPIVDEETFQAAVRVLTSPERRRNWGKGGFGHRENLLTGLAICGKCDGTFRAAYRRQSNGERAYKVYQCSDCKGVTLPAEMVDSYVSRKVIDRVEQWADMLPEGEAGPEVDTGALRTEEATLMARRSALGEDYAEGLIDRATMRSGAAKVDARLSEIADLLASAAVERHGFDINDTEALWVWSGGEDGELDVEKFRPVVERVCQTITLHGPGKGRRPEPSRDVVIEFRSP